MHEKFSLYRKAVGKKVFWYAKYWNEELRKFTAYRSTGVEVKGKGEQYHKAYRIANSILDELCYNLEKKLFVEYLKMFWEAGSAYFTSKAIETGKTYSGGYLKNAHYQIKNHIETYPNFSNLRCCDIKTRHVKDWIVWMSGKGASGHLINSTMQYMRVSLRYLLEQENIFRDPFAHIHEVKYKRQEKGILTKEEAAKLIAAPVVKVKRRLAMLLGLQCGMRAGEVLGLQWGDVDGDVIHIAHNYQTLDGVKAPKYDSFRDVPLPAEVSELLKRMKRMENNAIFITADGEIPTGMSICRLFRREMKLIGLEKDVLKKRNMSFHSLRHTFVTHGLLAGITGIEMQALSGHRSSTIQEKYTHAKKAINLENIRQKLGKTYS